MSVLICDTQGTSLLGRIDRRRRVSASIQPQPVFAGGEAAASISDEVEGPADDTSQTG